jgi:hypothetical protein
MKFFQGCMTPLVACLVCCIAAIVIGQVQMLIEKANHCTTIREEGKKDCPVWIYGINGVLGLVAFILCLFAIVKLFKPKFLC